MSQENVEVVKAALDAWPQGLDALSEHWTDDIDHRAIEGAIDDHGPLHGKDAVRATLRTGSICSIASPSSRWS